MEKFALLARVEAKPGKEEVVADFLKNALPMAEREPDTVHWYGLKIKDNTFGIFDEVVIEIFYVRGVCACDVRKIFHTYSINLAFQTCL